MATFRDDLGRVGKRLVETVQERAGVQVVPREELALLESDRSEARLLRKELHLLGVNLLNYEPGSPGQGGYELRREVRQFAARQSLTAWLEDPLAGQSVDLYVSFVLGRGVPRPQAHDPEVQEHLDKAWEDPANRRILTSHEKLVEKAIDLCLQATVPFTFFESEVDPIVRVSLLRFDDLDDAIRHSELAANGKGDRFRILYYRAFEHHVRYDFETGVRGTPRTERETAEQDHGLKKTVYYEAWDAFDPDDPVQAVQDEGLRRPSDAQLRPGKVYLLAVNKTSEMAFGVPRMRRLLNWYGAYNDMLVSFRDRMKAMASVYMQATAKGSQRDLERLGSRAVGRASAFGPATDVEGAPRPAGGGAVSPGVLLGNDAMKYEPFKIDSGSGDVSAAAPIMRSQVTGPWPDGYLSGNAEGSIAGQQSLELPTLKFVEREQELWAGLFRAFGKANIDAAVRTGDLSEWREPTQAELEQIANAEEKGEPAPFELNEQGQVKRDLSFDIALPNPLKRAMGDIVSAAVATATGVDPNGENPDMSRWLFATILAEAFDVEDPMRIVDEVLPRHLERTPNPAEQEVDPLTGEPLEGSIGPDGERHPADNPAGAPQNAPQPEDRKVQETPADDFTAVVRAAEEHLAALDRLPTFSVNGNGSGHH